ncbi:Clathrin heavy chain 1 [Phytophthora rubi]|uniref:Clathrin heavy chain 1 n=1 Tax=Phytophthora rubi TaxID=129364 RepID=A0A6A4G7Y3_9STRA|nr:Clathrin heavy chain 1 [Phytophthora rubi]KAE9020610.1 Clathrin heavy chain 1 [Phytophthora rubi]KAE9356988.1 Clathrin heavy chain 1 [Phytophthora rubi]
MAQDLPIVYGEVLNLNALGVSLEHVKPVTTTMESDKCVCVCEQVSGQGSVAIVDLSEGNTLQRRPIYADAAIMNPVTKIIALRIENQLQIFNIESRKKLKSHQMTESVVFWHWISYDTVAVITATAVFHWSIDDDLPPTKVFYRSASLGAEMEIVSYQASVDNQWVLLVGSSERQGGHVVGSMQLYSMEKKVSQVLQGYAGAFTQMKPPGRTVDTQVLVFAGIKADGQPTQLLSMEVGRDSDTRDAFHLASKPIPFDTEAKNDFPVMVLASPGDDIVYMITKMGYLFLFDAHSGTLIYRACVMQDTPFVTCRDSKSNGVLGITRRGQLLHFGINREKLVPYVLNSLRDPELALALASRMDLPGAEELFYPEFNRLVSVNDIQGAARLAAASPQGALRTAATIEIFKQMPDQLDQPQPILQYFSVLLEKGTLNKLESIELVRPVLVQGRAKLLQKWLVEDKLEYSEELGDVIAELDPMMALPVYLRAEVPTKVIHCFVQCVLKESKAQDPRALMQLCDRYDFVEELTQYLHSNNLMQYIDVYVTKVSPEKAPIVIGRLLDLGCSDDYINNLLNKVPNCPVGDLCEQVEKRNRLPLLQSWLEKRVARRNKDAVTHSSIAKIYVLLDKDPQQFLVKNKFYDSKVVGKFCETVDPSLAFLVYRRAWGECDDDLIRLATESGLFKDLARYLVERQDLDLWGKVLMKQEEGEANHQSRRALIDQVVHSALPESTKSAQVSTTVHAFMNAELSSELTDQNLSCVGMNRCFAFF